MMMNDTTKSGCGSKKKHNEGIHCNAKNCVYHDCDCYCTADMIQVGPSDATCSTDTICATFKEKK